MRKESIVREKPEYFNQMYFFKEGRRRRGRGGGVLAWGD